LALAIGVSSIITHHDTEALSTVDFNAGRIIEDSVFYNKDSMSAQQIQDFLNTLIPNCDTWGTAESGVGNLTDAQYAQQQGWAGPPYACINNYYENPDTGETSYEKGGGAFVGGISAAQIIYNAAQQYGINPQVLLVMLRKESVGPLTQDNWPLKTQYKYAMGYACPDSGPSYSADCDTTQAGFYKQVMKAAWQLNYYKNHINDYRYTLGTNQIQYSTDPTCGTKTVNIENIATLSLYIYTPYTPNDGSLANYPGTAPCGSYGNRNFFMFFKEWFGSPNYRPAACDSQLSGIACVWRLYDPNNVTDFLTASSQERDAAVINNKYSYENISFYAYTNPQSDTIPVYRIKLPDRYIYTASESEKDSLVADTQNTLEGVAFYAYPADASSNSTYPVYRLYGSRGNLLTTSAVEKDALVSNGYTYEGVAFNTPSAYAQTATPAAGQLNVYRMNNGKDHLYTTNLVERDALLGAGTWKYEGVLLEAPSQASLTPVYRLSNSEGHLFTTAISERDGLVQSGWTYEGIAWYTDATTAQTYRFYTSSGSHFYTTDLNEAATITNRGAKYEGIAWGYIQSVSTPIYRLYNGSDHFFTANVDEALSIANTGWVFEGTAWQSAAGGNPVYRLSKGAYHFYTSSVTEKSNLLGNGWGYEGIAWQSAGDTPIYRLIKGAYHFYTSNVSEKNNLVSNGWVYEGIAW
jgi:hypothetical protein